MSVRTAARAATTFLALLAFAITLPATAQALTFKVDNQSGRAANSVFATVAGSAAGYDVPGMANDVPVPLSLIPAQTVTINKLVSGRIYISYGAGVGVSVPFNSPTRFDWAELTVTPSSSADVANLTAVDQFGIGMRLQTFNSGGTQLGEVGSANSDTVFDAMQDIPGCGGDPEGQRRQYLRVLSPNQTQAYPELDQYVKSMSGKKVSLDTAFYGTPFTTSSYSGTFQSDGSIVLTGSSNPPGRRLPASASPEAS